MTQSIFQAQPFELPFDPRTTALVMIDMPVSYTHLTLPTN